MPKRKDKKKIQKIKYEKNRLDRAFEQIERGEPIRNFQRGEIYIIEPADNSGTESMEKRRPAVVISDVYANRGSNVRMVPLTSQYKQNLITNVSGINVDGVSATAICSMAAPVAVERILKLIAICPQADMMRISEALAYADGIHNIFLREASSNSRKAGDEAPELQNIDANEDLRRENERLKAEIKQKEQIYENAIQIICNQRRN